MGVMLSPGPPTPLKWYYRPAWVLFLLFGVYLALFIEETMRVFRAVEREMNALGTVADF